MQNKSFNEIELMKQIKVSSWLLVFINPGLILCCFKKIQMIKEDTRNLSYCIVSLIIVYAIILSLLIDFIICLISVIH